MHLKQVTFYREAFPCLDLYPFNLEIFRRTTHLDFTTPVTFFVGENGTGKSTLLEAVARKCGIHIWRAPEWTRYEINPYEREFHRFLSVTWTDGWVPGSFFAAEIFKHFSQNLDEWAAADPGMLRYFGGKSLMTQSHGQSLLSFFRSRYRIKGLYLLDEPETALSPKSQIELLALLRDFGRDGKAQFIIASHSPILLALPEAVIYSFDQAPIRAVAYEDTDYYRIYKDFMTDRTKYL